MKKVQYVLGMIVCCIIMLLSCSKSNDVSSSALLPELVQAEEIMYESPDSALHILQAMPIPQPSDKLQYATWALLITQAKYKLDVDQSDSLINKAYEYFDRKDNHRRKAMVFYYKGILCKDNRETQELLLKAIEEIEKTNDYKLAHIIYAELGGIYIYRSLLEYALNAYNKSREYAQLALNHQQEIASYIYLGRTYSLLEDDKKSIDCYLKAIEICKLKEEKNKQIFALSELAGVYKKVKDYEAALIAIKSSIELRIKDSIKITEQQYLVLGEIYKELNYPDSALFYLEKALCSTNVYTIREASINLFYLKKQQMKYKEATDYLEKSWMYHDSIQKADKSKTLIEMQEKYDQQKIINEKNEIELKKNVIIFKILIFLIIGAVFAAILIYIYQKRILKKERLLQDAEEQIRIKALQIQENESIISRNKIYMDELNEEIEKNRNIQEQIEEQKVIFAEIKQNNENLIIENGRLQNDINSISYTLKEKSKEIVRLEKLSENNIYLRDRERFLSQQLMLKNETLRKLKDFPKYIEIVQWQKIINDIDTIYDNYTKRLAKFIPSLTESDIQICCLIKLHLPNPTIAILLAISPASVSKRKQRLKERIIQKNGSLGDFQTLDVWLWNF